jgi:hypothetical protein
MRTIAVILTGLAAAIAAPVACPQAQPQAAAASALARALTADLTCTMPAARIGEAFQQRVGESSAPSADILAALNEIAGAADTCTPLREAALGVAAGLSAAAAEPPPPEVDAETAALANLVLEAFTEADRRAARPVFDSPPPPRNLTRGRISTP